MRNKKAYFHIKTSKKKKALYLRCFNDYRDYNNQVGVDSSLFFSYVVTFLLEKYKKQGVYEKAPEEFLKVVFRAGKRAVNERTPGKDEIDELHFVAKENVNIEFGDLAWCFAKTYSDSIVKNPCYSKSYFFYDLVVDLEKYSSELINYKKYEV